VSRIRVLVADDSAVRQVVTTTLESDSRFEVAGAASQGASVVTISPLDRIAAVINRWLDAPT
jgi:hypothetical protein